MRRWLYWYWPFISYRVGMTATSAALLVLRHKDWTLSTGQQQYTNNDFIRFTNAQWEVTGRWERDRDYCWAGGVVKRKSSGKEIHWSGERAPRKLLKRLDNIVRAYHALEHHRALARVMGCGDYNCKICLAEAIIEGGGLRK